MRRGWFQFHLSTALMLMFFAAGMVYANVQQYLLEENNGVTSYNGASYENHYRIFGMGWPSVHCRHFVYGVKEIPDGYYPINRGLLIDIGVALGILIGAGIVIELIFRHKNRNG